MPFNFFKITNYKHTFWIYCVLGIALFFSNICFSQSSIQGSVSGRLGHLDSATVLLKDSLSHTIVAFAIADEKGAYIIKAKETGTYNLVFASLGHTAKTIPLHLNSNSKDITLDVILDEKLESLDEVIIRSELPMSIKKDTITFKAKHFSLGNEQTVEDLLKRIPGISIDPNGTIKVGNQEIEKLMIDGDDLFEKGYRLLSKNMPAYPIENIEILQNYSNNRLLKGIEDSDKVALNLKLDEQSKHVWFGSIDASIGNDDFYQYKANLMNFGNKNKYYFFTNLNTIGYNATGDIQNLIRPFRLNELGSIGDNESVTSLLNLSSNHLDLKERKTNFNKANLVSLNAVFNPTEQLKIKTLGFLNGDTTDLFRNSTDVVDINNETFTNTEDYKSENKKRIAFGKLDLVYNISQTKMLEATTQYNNGDFNDSSHLVFNGTSTIENLQHQNTLFDQKVNFTNTLKDKQVLLLTGRFINEKAPQQYNTNQFFFQDIFPSMSTANNVNQNITNHMQFAGINAHVLARKNNKNLLELQLGNTIRKDRLQTQFEFLENTIVLEQPEGYQNQTVYQVNDLYFKSKYRLEIKNFAIVGKLDMHQLFNRLALHDYSTCETPFFINPSIGFDWKLNHKNKIITSYAYNSTNAQVLDVMSDFVLTSFRSFSKGTGDFSQLNASNATFNYELGNWSDRFFANAFIMYSKNHDFFSTHSYIEQNFTQTEKILIKDREFINLNATMDYYFKFLSSNLKIDLGYTKTEFKNSVNQSDLRRVTSNNFDYGLELRSAFKGIFNYHVGTKWTTTRLQSNTSKSFTNTVSFLDASFVFSDAFNVQFQAERYYYTHMPSDDTYYFLDFEARYKLIENKLNLGISANNLFNTSKFTNYYISDIGSSTTEYRLLPRLVLLQLEYRF